MSRANDLDFHPTDVIEDADGSLVIVDTGGWYKLCCPTSQLQKPDVLGAIYRVRRLGAPRVVDARGTDLGKRIDDVQNRHAIGGRRQIARRLAAGRGAASDRVPCRARRKSTPNWPRCVRSPPRTPRPACAATSSGRSPGSTHPGARLMVHDFFLDPDETVRQAAIHVAGLWRDKTASRLIELLNSPSAHNRRAAAEALGRIGDTAAVPALLEAAGRADDRILEHSITYALIDIADPEGDGGRALER